MRPSNHLSLLFALCLAGAASAQNIGINVNGAAPHQSALLDIDAGAMVGAKRGLLIPRMTAVEMNAIVAPATSLLVFNSTANSFFYFNGTAWVALSAGAGWGLTGNAGTNQATNFIGTSDNQPLRFRVNNTVSGRLGATATENISYGFNSGSVGGTGNVAIGGNAATANTTGQLNTMVGSLSGAANTTGSSNVFIGAHSGMANQTGTANTFLGASSGNSATTAVQNTFIGNSSGASTTTGSSNVHVGANSGNAGNGNSNTFLGSSTAFANTTGSGNVFIGSSAGAANTTGTNNILIGANADHGIGTLTNATAIGRSARVDASNSMVLGGISGINGGTSTNVGIGTTTPADRLHVVGGIRMVDGNQAIGRIPVSDVNGHMTWTDPLAVANNLAWTLTGNAGTNPAINYIGTSDAQSLNFRVNNAGAGTLSNTLSGMVSYGLQAGAVNTGIENTMIGSRAGFANTTGMSNTMVGYQAGLANTTGTSNIFIGRGSALVNTTGNGNTFVGNQSGEDNTTGTFNTFVGSLAGASNITGNQNAFFGNGAGSSFTTGSSNTAVGAGANLASGNNNTALGSSAGGLTTGDGNTYVGRNSGSSTTTGSNNVFLGNSSAQTNTTGSNNVTLGNLADQAAANLTNSVAIGAFAEAGASNSIVLGGINGVNGATASTNVGIGTTTPADRLHVVGNIRMEDGNQAAGRVLTSDANGTATWQLPAASNDWGTLGNAGTNAATDFIGTTDAQPLRFRVANLNAGQLPFNNLSTLAIGVGSGIAGTGPFNVFVGDNIATAHTTGSSNTAVGSGAATNLSTGSANVMLGGAAGLMTNASSNTLLGFAAGQNNTTGGSNAFVGRSAGLTNVSGSGNTVVGTNADVATGALSNATAIGQLAEVATSNSMVLGSINGVNGATASVNVGIGTTTPADRLHVVGNIRMVDGNQAAGHVLTSDVNGTATWQNASANAWGLVGNAGTNPATNFIGTTDFQPVRFRVQNSWAGQIPISPLDVLAIGRNAGAVTTGQGNTFMGTNAGQSNTTGASNTALGHGSAFALTTGTGNTLIGRNAGVSITSGTSNTIVGSNAGTSMTGADNAFFGTGTGAGTTTGSDNTMIGTNSGTSNVIGSGLVLIGSQTDVAGGGLVNATAIGEAAQVDASNSMVLGSVAGVNGAAATVNVGVGVNAPITRMDINGGLTIRRPSNIPLVTGVNNITVGNNSYLRLSSATGIAATTVTLSDGLVTGQVLVIEGTGLLGNGFTIADNNNTNLGSDAAMNIQDSLTLIWNGVDWLEIGRSVN